MTLASDSKTRETSIFGASDGLVASIALILATSGHGPRIVLTALVALLAAEGIGMAGSEYLSDPKMDLKQASVMGAATSLAIIGPGIPWTVSRGTSALLASGVIAVCFASVIAQLRPGGLTTWVQTFGVLSAVAGLAALAGHIA